MSRRSLRLTPEDLSPWDAERLQHELDRSATLSVGNATIVLSEQTKRVLSDLLEAIAAGKHVDVTPVAEILTTQEAADLMRVSRPTLVKMLDQGLLAYEQPGVHRRIRRAAVEDFLATRRQRRRAALDALAETHDAEGPDRPVETR